MPLTEAPSVHAHRPSPAAAISVAAPSAGPAETMESFSVLGFLPNCTYELFFDTTQGNYSTGAAQVGFDTDPNGSADFKWPVTPNTNQTPGSTYWFDIFYNIGSDTGQYGAFVGTFLTSNASDSGAFFLTDAVATLSPAVAPPGTLVTFNASGLTPGREYNLMRGAIAGSLPPVLFNFTANETGDYTQEITVSSTNFPVGTYFPSIVETASNDSIVRVNAYFAPSYQATFYVFAPSLALYPQWSGPLGTELGITGYDFAYDEAYYLCIEAVSRNCVGEGNETLQVETNASGEISQAFKLEANSNLHVGPNYIQLFEKDNDGLITNATSPASGLFTLTIARVALSPTSGPVGTTVAVNATGLAPYTYYNLSYVDPTAFVLGENGTLASTFVTDANGNYSGTFVVPEVDYGNETYDVVIREWQSGNFITFVTTPASGTFNVTGATLFLKPTKGPVGTVVDVTGGGYVLSDTSVEITGEPLGAFPETCGVTDGAIDDDCEFTVGDVPAGRYLITATGNSGAPTDNRSAYFTVGPTWAFNEDSGTLPTSELTASGNGWAPGAISFSYVGSGSVAATAGACVAGADGAFSDCPFSITAAPAGAQQFQAKDSAGNLALANFTVDSNWSFSKASGTLPTAALTASGTGWAAGAIAFAYTGTGVVTFAAPGCAAEADGSFTACPFSITAAPVGPQPFRATDSALPPDSVKSTFTVLPSWSFTPGTAQVPTLGLTASGAGWAPGVIAFSYEGLDTVEYVAGACTAGPDGSFAACPFSITATPNGPQPFEAKDSAAPADTANAVFTPMPSIALSLTSAPAAYPDVASGDGFTAGSTITVSIGATTVPCLDGSVAADGSFSCNFRVPLLDHGGNPYGVTATDSAAVTTSLDPLGTPVTFSIDPLVAVSPVEATPGTAGVQVVGSGFSAGALVTVSWNTTPAIACTAATVATDGSWSCTFTLPRAKVGTYTLLAVDTSGVSTNAPFSVVSANLTATSPSATTNPVHAGSPTTISVPGPSGGVRPYRFNWTGLPPGCSDPGNVSSFACTPTAPGTYAIGVTVSDAVGVFRNETTALVVVSSSAPTEYLVAFNESGLPAGMQWWVNFTGGGASANSTGTQLVTALADGTYGYTVAVAGITWQVADPTGNLTVSGGSPAPTQVQFERAYEITATESGLSPGTAWGLVIGGTLSVGPALILGSPSATAPVRYTFETTASTLWFALPNGTYTWVVFTEAAGVVAPLSRGTETVDGGASDPSLTFPFAPTSTGATVLGLPTTEFYGLVAGLVALGAAAAALALLRSRRGGGGRSREPSEALASGGPPRKNGPSQGSTPPR